MNDNTPETITGTQPVEIVETPQTPELQEPSQNPIETELNRIRTKEPRSEAEKAAFALKKNAERAKELGIDPADVLGIKPQLSDDEAPMTVALYKQLEREKNVQTAETMADEQIADTKELELVKYHLTNTIKPSGSAVEDLRNARRIVNSIKNTQILEETARAASPQRFSSGSGAPAIVEKPFEPTPEEAQLMKGFGLTKEQVLDARKKTELLKR
jgi:hypothetical protein